MPAELIRCNKCGAMIGEIVSRYGREFLVISGIYVATMHGVCQCGNGLHYSLSEKALTKLIQDSQKPGIENDR